MTSLLLNTSGRTIHNHLKNDLIVLKHFRKNSVTDLKNDLARILNMRTDSKGFFSSADSKDEPDDRVEKVQRQDSNLSRYTVNNQDSNLSRYVVNHQDSNLSR